MDVTGSNFQQEVTESTMPVVIDFWAPWCGPCKMFAPTFAALAEENQNIKFVKINVDEEPEIAKQFGVRGIPTLTFVKGGEVVKTLVGAQQKPAVSAVLATLS